MFKEIKIFKKFFNYLPKKLKKKFLWIVLSTILLGIFEMVSISIIIPIISILLNVNSDGFLINQINSLGFEINYNIETMLVVSVILFLIFFFRSIYVVWHSFYQSQYIYQIQEYVASKLYNLRGFTYLDKKTNLSFENLSHKIINESSQLSIRFSGPLCIIFAELCIVIGLFFLMFVFNFLAALIFFSVTLISSGLFYYFAKKKVEFWGKQYINKEQARTDLVMRGINDGLQIYLLGLRSYFINVFQSYNSDISKLLTFQRTMILSPRVVVELFSLVAIFMFMFVFIYLETDSKDIFATAILIAFLGMRAMPSLNKIAMSLQDFRFARPLIESIMNEFAYKDELIQKNLIFRKKPPVLIAKGILNIKGKIKRINLSVRKKESVIITGPSGCGKSTLLRSIIGLDENLNEVSFYKKSSKKLKIAFLNSSANLFKISLIENILLGRKLSKKKLALIIDICRLKEFDLLGNGAQKIIEKNNFKPSSGEKQRIILARALVGNPEILVLDEALSAIDKKNYYQIEHKLLTFFPGILIHVSHHNINSKAYTHRIRFK